MQQNQPNPQMDAAREAVKKQLLQALMQQVVEEIAAKTPTDLALLTTEIVDAQDLSDIRSRITADATRRLEDRIAATNFNIDTAAFEHKVQEKVQADLVSRFKQHSDAMSEELIDTTAKQILDDPAIIEPMLERLRSHCVERISGKVSEGLRDADALDWLDESAPGIAHATEKVEEHVRSYISDVVARRLNDTERVVDGVVTEFGTDNEQIIKAVEATRERLVGRVADLTVSRLKDAGEVATLAAARIPQDQAIIQNAVAATLEGVLDDIVGIAEKRMKDSQSIASDARDRMMKVIPEVQEAAELLEGLLLSESAATATDRLSDATGASRKARELIGKDAVIDRVQRSLEQTLTEEIAGKAVKTFADIKKASSKARALILDDHDVLVRTQAALRDRLVSEIAQRTVDSLKNTKQTAVESLQKIPADLEQLDRVRIQTRSMVIDDIVRLTIDALSNTDKTADEVVSKVDNDHETIRKVSDVVRRRMFESLLSSALSDLGSKVRRTSEDGEQELFREALRSLAGSTDPANEIAHKELNQMSAPSDEGSAPQSDASFEPDAFFDAGEDEHVGESVGWTRLSDIRRDHTAHETDPSESGMDSAPEAGIGTKEDRTWTVSEFRPAPADASNEYDSPETGEERVSPELDASHDANDVIYVYGIMSREWADQTDFRAIEAIEPGRTVALLECGNLVAIMSRVSVDVYGRDVLPEYMKDTEWVREQVRQHAGVLSDVPTNGTIVPLRFGIIFDDTDALRGYVEARHDHYVDALDRLHDRSEFGVRMYCNAEGLQQALGSVWGAESPLSPEARAAIEALGSDATDEEAMQIVLEECIRRSHGLLGSRSDGAVVKPRDNVHAELPLNATYLVASDDEKQFQDAVHHLADELGTYGITFEVSGPWPPYHFVDVDPGKMGPVPTEIPA